MRPVLNLLAVLGVVLVTWSPGVRVVGAVLMGDNGAAWAQAYAGIGQLIVSCILVAYTVVTVRLTRKAVEAAASSAAGTRAAVDESSKAREQAREQNIDAAMPVVALRIAHSSQTRDVFEWDFRDFDIVATNVGTGPALDLVVDISEAPVPLTLTIRRRTITNRSIGSLEMFASEALIQPFYLGAGAESRVNAWGMDDKLQAAEQSVTRATADDYFGTIAATYADVHGRRYRSSARIRSDQVTPKPISGLARVVLDSMTFERVDPSQPRTTEVDNQIQG